jgi:hypothetical protein
MLISPDVQIKSITEANELVKNVAVLVHEGTAYVGIITHPIFTKSERSALVSELMLELNGTAGVKNVVISLDTKSYHNIKTAAELQAAGKCSKERIARIVG